MLDSHPRILITRLSHIGDCILTIPMLRALRRQYPNSFIAWAVESPSQQLLSLVAGLDEIITVPKEWISRPSAWRDLRRRLRQFKFDVAIDPQGITKSALLGWLSGAQKRIGIRGQWGRELSPWLNNQLVSTRRNHLVDRSLELLQPFDIHNAEVEFRLPVDSSSDELMNRFLQEIGIGERFVLINPGASWPSKRWELDRFSQVAFYLWAHHGSKCVITWSGDKERSMAESIESMAKSAVVLAPQTNLRQLAALSGRALFFIGCDTGPMHIAAAMNTPCLGLYGPTRPQDSGAYGPSHVHLQKYYHSGSSRERRSASNEAMREIMVSDVCAAVDQMVAKTKTHDNKSESNAA